MSALAHVLERKGIATVLIGLVPQHVERMRPPRSLLVPFELGRPLGAPGDRAFQRRVMTATLSLAERTDVPVIAWFEEQAPTRSEDEEGWACPVSFAAPVASDDPAIALQAEIDLLRPWHDRAVAARGRSGVGASGLEIDEAAVFLAECLRRLPATSPVAELSFADAFKLAAEDLKLFYLEAATAQPGASSRDLADWFWDSTAAGKLLCTLAEQLSETEDSALRLHVLFTLVPESRRGE